MTIYGKCITIHDNLMWLVSIYYNFQWLLPESCDGDSQKSTKLSDKAENNLRKKLKFRNRNSTFNDSIFMKFIFDWKYLNSKVAGEREYKGIAIGVLRGRTSLERITLVVFVNMFSETIKSEKFIWKNIFGCIW